MARLSHHPTGGVGGGGVGEILPGWFAVPQNPFAPQSYTPGIGEILEANYVVPQNPFFANPVMDYQNGNIRQLGKQPGMPGSINGSRITGGCGCGSGVGKCSCSGMSGVSDDISGMLTQEVAGIPIWMLGAGAILAVLVLKR